MLTSLHSQRLPEDDVDEEAAEELFAEDYRQILAVMPHHSPKLPPIQASDSASKPFGQGTVDIGALDLSALVKLRYHHQTRHAALAIRTKGLSEVTNSNTETKQKSQVNSAKRDLIRQFQAILKEQQAQGLGTGQECVVRWRAEDGTNTLPATGNAANAIAVASQAAKKVLSHCFALCLYSPMIC